MNIKLAKNKNFLLYILGQTSSTFGTNILGFATALYVFELTGSAAKYASIVALTMIPSLIFGPFAGTITDIINRKNLIIFGDLLRGTFELLLFIYSLKHPIGIGIMYALVIFFSICETFFDPAFTTLLPLIVLKDELTNAISIKKTLGRLISVSTPLLGALIVKLFSFNIVLLIDSISYFIGAFCGFYMDIAKSNKLTTKINFLKDTLIGFKATFSNKQLFLLMLNNIFTNIFIIPFIAIGLPYIILEVLCGSQIDYGTVQSFATAGSIVSIFAVMISKKHFNISKCLNLGILVIIISCSLLIPLINPSIISMLYKNSLLIIVFFSLIIFMFRLSNAFYDVFYSSCYQTKLPIELLGRYVAIEGTYLTLARLIGLKLFGYLFDSSTLFVPIVILSFGLLLKTITHVVFINITKINKPSLISDKLTLE